MTDRPTATARFLEAHGWAGATRQPLAGDASARHYERLIPAAGQPTILVDSPYPVDDVFPFITVAGLLRDLGLSVPTIIAAEPADGLMLLEDFGDGTFTRLLGAGAAPEDLYALAVDVLIALHRGFTPERARGRTLPRYDAGLFVDQVMLFAEVYVPAALGKPLSDNDRSELETSWRTVVPEAVAAVPQSLLLRDYHVDNLMHLSGREGVAACGLLDFQSAGLGPVSYDLVSLLEDARRDVPITLAASMVERYLHAFPELDPAAFMRSYAVLGAVRHTRIIGIFARLALSQGRHTYLEHLPRVWRLLEGQLRQPVLGPVAAWFDRLLPTETRGFLIPEAVS